MDPLTLALLGGGAGLLKGLFVDGPQAAQQNKINAAVARYSPWTNMRADTTHQNPNTIGDVLTGGLAGGMLGQSGLLADAAPGPAVAAPGAVTASAQLSTPNPWDNLNAQRLSHLFGGR